jgi:prevent-host-death family protein
VNIHAAKTHLSRLVARAADGEEIVIARGGKPVARLGPLAAEPAPRKPGLLRGRITVADDFDAPLSDALLREFYGGQLVPRRRRR